MYSSWKRAKKVAVLGAGTMGSGIAAHMANLGFEVTLFDLSKDSVRTAFDRAKSMKPPHFYDLVVADSIRLASIQDDLSLIQEMDWVCEAVVEKMEVKRNLYEQIEPLLRDDAMISTNTSGLEIRLLSEGRSDSFRRRFIGTHFFNPPRYLKLIELIPTKDTDPESIAAITEFLEDGAGRRVVLAKDTPGFIANRYGMWALFHAIHTAEKLRLSIETVDTIMGQFAGRPRTGIFRLADLIGLDIMQDIAKNLKERCSHDSRSNVLELPATTAALLAEGRIGSKVGKGYYERAGKEFFVTDFDTMAYRPQQDPDLPTIAELRKKPIGERLRESISRKDEVGDFVREHLAVSLEYAAEIAKEVSYSVKDFDQVMKWGWGWELGPFELMDAIGRSDLKPYWVGNPLGEHAKFYRENKYLDFDNSSLVESKRDLRFETVGTLPEVQYASNWKIRQASDSSFVFEFNSKMNALSPDLVKSLHDWIVSNPGIKITLANEGRAFSAGFDLTWFLQASEEGRFDDVEKWLYQLQACGLALRNSPSAAALQGYVLGGGMELAMHCQTVIAHPEAVLGLPETAVGLIPAGGGTALLRYRSQGDAKAMAAAATLIIAGTKVNAPEAKKAFLLRDNAQIVRNPDQLHYVTLNASREKATDPVWSTAPPQLASMIEDSIESLRKSGEIGDYGVALGQSIKHVFVKPSTYEEALEMEREQFLQFLGKPMTIARIKHMLETGKPLVN